MKKLVFVILTILFVCSAAFASWQIGTVVDDFGDTTGEGFVYSLTEGTFSNSATSKSTAYIRVLASFISDPYPKERWTFEIHDYNWDNPIERFYDNSLAIIKIKEDDGTVTTFTRKNSEGVYIWNSLEVSDGYAFTEMLERNSTLKISISIENYRYNFTLDCRDFYSVYHRFFDSLEPNIGKWSYSDIITPSTRSLFEELKSMYKKMGKNKQYPYGSYGVYEETQDNNASYLYSFILDNEDYSSKKYVNVNLSVYDLDKTHKTPSTSMIHSKEIASVSIIQNGISSSMKLKNDSVFTWSSQQSLQGFVDNILNGSTATLRITTKSNKTIDIVLGKDFAEYHEKAKTIKQF